MIPRFVPPRLTIVPTGNTPGFLTTDRMLILQRRGVTEILEAQAAFGAVMAQPNATGAPRTWTVRVEQEIGTQSVEAANFDAAYRTAAELAGRMIGFPISRAPFVASAEYGLEPSDVTSGDRIVSPLCYEPGSDTVRIVGNGVCAAVFDDGAFANARTFERDVAGSAAWPFLARALATGFDAAHLDRGSDYCKRRLAWLAGALWLADAMEPLVCGVLNLNMTRPGLHGSPA